jgi:molecular chaperone GrpE
MAVEPENQMDIGSLPNESVSQPAPDTASTPAVETIPSLEEVLKKAELAVEEHHDAWLRAKAETENVRKRSQVELANAHKFAIESFALELLAVIDSLEAALSAPSASPENLKNGVELTLKQLQNAFARFNLTAIDPQGEKFDPHRHQAMGMVEGDKEPHTVVQVIQKGYSLNERVLRPALVMIAKPRES